MNVFPSEKIESFVRTADNCTSQYGAECRQYWRTSLNLKRDTCTLDGVYTYNFTVNCGECCLTNCSLSSKPEDYFFNVEFRLRSENFCAEIVVDVGIAGNIRSYENDSYVGSKAAFTVKTRAFYLIKVNSELNLPKAANGSVDPDLYDPSNPGHVVSFSKVDLVRVVLVSENGSELIIWNNKATVDWSKTPDKIDYKTLCQAHTTKAGGANLPENSVGFSFVWSREVANVPKSKKLSLLVRATVQVTYSNISKKRYILQTTGSDETGFNQTSDIDDDGTGPDTTLPTTAVITDTTGPSTSGATTSGATTSGATTSGATTTSASQVPTTTDTSNSYALIASLMILIIALLI
jgi:hypothetical protein